MNKQDQARDKMAQLKALEDSLALRAKVFKENSLRARYGDIVDAAVTNVKQYRRDNNSGKWSVE